MFEEFSGHCLCLVLSEDGAAIVFESTTLFVAVVV